ncbi:MurR/RpiR family transcriptional regulator [Paracoccus ravus]|uniref:MurR/RpiR family transcriptional regulator n=1 Tax=Paracoccus ravus TaxID=2447760 RepID=UPI00106ED414|nr:MurR/RpiR family transcriptional regulator [Paracoccus ravus]
MTKPTEPLPASRFSARLHEILPMLSKSEARIAQFLLLNQSDLGDETGASVASKSGVSQITVSRFLRRIGYKGISALRDELRADRVEAQVSGKDRQLSLLPGDLSGIIAREAEAVIGLAAQLSRPEWAIAIQALCQRDIVYVAGFQTIRGLSEDFARRLGITRGMVQMLSPHDTGLSEWISHPGEVRRSAVLVLVDIVPYARDAAALARICKRKGIDLIVVSDEFNNWAYAETPLVFHAATKAGAFLESTGPLASLLNLMLHCVASGNPEQTRHRLEAWPGLFKEFDLY